MFLGADLTTFDLLSFQSCPLWPLRDLSTPQASPTFPPAHKPPGSPFVLDTPLGFVNLGESEIHHPTGPPSAIIITFSQQPPGPTNLKGIFAFMLQGHMPGGAPGTFRFL